MLILIPRDRPYLIAFEAVAMIVALLLAFGVPNLRVGWCRRAERALGRLARQRGLSIAVVGLLGIASSSMVSLFVRFPQPAAHDEFSYLLAADTFAHGRLTNPSHPMWMHFESLHIIQQPSYASKYPPAQGLILALGKMVGGHAIVGVWLSAGLACAALYWMLLGWLPPRWALLGGLLGLMRVATFGYWGQSYWGGAVAMLGGALVLGAVRRIVHRPRLRHALVLGLGLAILANSRPYEGFLMGVPVGAALLLWMASAKAPSARVSILRVVLPVLVVLGVTVGVMAAYNSRVTGQPLRLPYQVHEASYGNVPVFLWQRLKPEPEYRHDLLRTWGRFGAATFEKERTGKGLVRAVAKRVGTFFSFYFGILFAVPLVALPWVLRDKWMRFAVVTCAVVLTGVLALSWFYPHYPAPITGLIFAVVLQGMRHLRLWRPRGRPVGELIVWMIPLVTVASLGLSFALDLRSSTSEWQFQRASIETQLARERGRHLVIVRYAPSHHTGPEWVYNEADIDGARVVWSREMDPEQNQKLLEYFRDRRVWLLKADVMPRELTPYAAGPTASAR